MAKEVKKVFADTFYFLAIAVAEDQWHQQTLAIQATLGRVHIYTIDEMLTEFLAAMSGRGRINRRLGVDIVRQLLSDEFVTVLHQSHQSFLDGLELYEKRDDKGYSLVDCISMNTCRQHRISDILTNDHHFEQEGFNVLVSENP